MYSYEDIFGTKQRVLFVTAHPDDVDAYWGGLVARLNHDRKDTFLVLVTNGARGSRENRISEAELAVKRIGEQQAALTHLGMPPKNFVCLQHLDGEFECCLPLIGEIAKYIRLWKPEIVVSHEPQALYTAREAMPGFSMVNHRDHRVVGTAVLDAVYPFSRDRSFFPQHAQENLEPHTVNEILFSDEFRTNARIDVTIALEKKKAALRAHGSQFDETVIQRILDSDRNNEQYFESGNYLKIL